MNSEYATFLTLAGIPFGIALLSVMAQWLKADDLGGAMNGTIARGPMIEPRSDRERGLFSPILRRELPNDARRPTEPAAPSPSPVTMDQPKLMADDEAALSRLCVIWGTVGMVVGLAGGGAMFGMLGMLLGAVITSTAAIGLVVAGVLLRDRAKMAEWRKTTQR